LLNGCGFAAMNNIALGEDDPPSKMKPANFEQRLLYGILDLNYVDAANAPSAVSAMIAGGVDIVQLRGKSIEIAKLTALAAELHPITAKHDVPLIINDHAEIARSVPLDGVHVGQDDISIARAREIGGRDLIVGKSTHSFEQAIAAEKEGADYIGFGPLFATPTKPDYVPIGLADIRKVHDAVPIPIFCIGGIKLNNLMHVIAAGAQRVVIVSGLLQSKNIEAYAETAKRALLAQRGVLK
jgi:thiamine-phosphate pyrophosphorylase